MQRYLITLLLAFGLIAGCGQPSSAAVLVQQSSGAYVTKASLSDANTAADAAGKRIKLTGPITMTGNITLATDRQWDFSDTVITTTGYTLTCTGADIKFPDSKQVFAGTGSVVGLSLEVNAAWFGVLTSNSAAANATILNKILGAYSKVYLPSGSYNVTALTMIVNKQGQTFRGDPSYDDGTGMPTGGTVLVSDNITCLTITGDADNSNKDRTYIDGLAFVGSGTTSTNGKGIYLRRDRQGTFSRLFFHNLDTCIHSESMSWLNKYSDIKGFGFNKGMYLNSGSEDSVYENIIMRGYSATSVGLHLNYYAEVNTFINCDFSDNNVNVLIQAGLGNPVLTFIGCIFEQGDGASSTYGINSLNSVDVVINMIGGRMLLKNGLTTQIAFAASGTGQTYMNMYGFRVNDYENIFKTTSGAGWGYIKGEIYIAGTSTYTLFDSITGTTDLVVHDNNNQKEKYLLSTWGRHGYTHDFTTAWEFDLGKLGTAGAAKIVVFQTSGPDTNKYGEFLVFEKGAFVNGIVNERLDNGAIFTASVSGNTLTITSTTAFNGTIKVIKQ